jgi:hypothetical protein
VFHQSTENFIKGKLNKPIIAITDAAIDPCNESTESSKNEVPKIQ